MMDLSIFISNNIQYLILDMDMNFIHTNIILDMDFIHTNIDIHGCPWILNLYF